MTPLVARRTATTVMITQPQSYAMKYRVCELGPLRTAKNPIRTIDKREPDQGAGGPARVECEPTAAGREAFVELLETALSVELLETALSADGRELAETMAGIGFITSLTRARAVDLLQSRIEVSRDRRARVVVEYEQNPDEDWAHHLEAMRFWAHSADSAIQWTEGLIARLEAGEYTMSGEEATR